MNATENRPTKKTSPPLVIEPNCVYRKSTAMQILGLGRSGWQDLVDRGLKVVYLSKSACVFGRDLIAAIETYRDEEPPAHRRRQAISA